MYRGHDTTLEGIAKLTERLGSHGADVTSKLYDSHHYQFIPEMLTEYLKQTYPPRNKLCYSCRSQVHERQLFCLYCYRFVAKYRRFAQSSPLPHVFLRNIDIIFAKPACSHSVPLTFGNSYSIIIMYALQMIRQCKIFANFVRFL